MPDLAYAEGQKAATRRRKNKDTLCPYPIQSTKTTIGLREQWFRGLLDAIYDAKYSHIQTPNIKHHNGT